MDPEIKLPTFTGSWRKQGYSRKTTTSASLTTQAFDYVDHNKLWKTPKHMGVYTFYRWGKCRSEEPRNQLPQVKSFSLACSLSYTDNYGKRQMVINIKRQTTLYVSWETFMRVKKQQLEIRRGTNDWFTVGKGVQQGCILSTCLFNLHAEYIMCNAGLDESQAGIKSARRNINNLRYTDDTTQWQKVKRN